MATKRKVPAEFDIETLIQKHMDEKKSRWKESASLLLFAKNEDIATPTTDTNNNNEVVDYKLLMAERSANTSIFNNTYVFPGGHFDVADEEIGWMTYFEEFGVSQSSLKQLIVRSAADNEPRPRILEPKGEGCYDRFFKKSEIWAREISLRLTALRETFEEVGVLLCRRQDQLDVTFEGGCARFVDNFNRTIWQRTVHDNAKMFLELCRVLRVVPDLWALYEWSAWASPAVMIRAQEVVFFIAFMPRMPDVVLDTEEMKDYQWKPPGAFLELYNQGKIYLMPPQIYELSRFFNISKFDALLSFARERSTKGITTNLPVICRCLDGVVSVLPGDDNYPADPRRLNSFVEINYTIAQFNAKAKRLHRCIDPGMVEYFIYLNFELPHGHLQPQNIQRKNKL